MIFVCTETVPLGYGMFVCTFKTSVCLIDTAFKMGLMGVVGWCEGAVYLASLGRPTDIGLQLGKACYPCSG